MGGKRGAEILRRIEEAQPEEKSSATKVGDQVAEQERQKKRIARSLYGVPEDADFEGHSSSSRSPPPPPVNTPAPQGEKTEVEEGVVADQVIKRQIAQSGQGDSSS